MALPQLLEQVRGRMNSSGDTARQIQERRAKIEAIYHEARKKSQAGEDVGYGLPSSIGAALGHKGSGRLCVSIIGDGDFLITSNAL